MLLRYFVEFSYNGTRYHGWQSQPNALTVQEELTKAFCLLLSADIALVGAGRTDAGVHAKQMFAHFDYPTSIDVQKLVQRLNAYLSKDIAVINICQVDDEAHARFDATSREYKYYLHTQKNPFVNEVSWHQHRTMDFEKMNQAAKILFDYNDFECFSKTHTDVYTYICEIYTAEWTQLNEHQWVFTIAANRFLRNMVRAIVGTLVDVGIGKIEVEEMHQIIQSKNRGQAGFSVPACGLHLVEVKYPYIKKNENT